MERVSRRPSRSDTNSKRDSAEYRAFRKCFSALADGITDPGRLAVQLYSRELIGPDLRTEAQKQAVGERVKIVNILSAVEDQIVASPATKFSEFLDVLQSEPSLQHLATRLENAYHELQNMSQPTFTQASLPIDAYTSYLKSVYSSKKPPIYRWPQVKCKKYINLAFIEKEDITKQEADQFTRDTIHGKIDDIMKSKRATKLGEIAQLPDGPQPKCILVAM